MLGRPAMSNLLVLVMPVTGPDTLCPIIWKGHLCDVVFNAGVCPDSVKFRLLTSSYSIAGVIPE